ncbi:MULTISPECIES: hypothetical protein [unclassified Fusibacter]|uniref:hypothetical protein n=1 Tax=unclassified Fusibacter TaxID=2624464 RepID=UPI00101142F6|nr:MULTISPECIES: hypothetical protein [unclassified Fusibacter]MCK8061224.1 hypothetical protein [Fusibacter sp. A2]NPE23432.1 hypothetical protein [Fusibacter sp. A1]RXV59211.1 hypothetical protein DWB64_16575 [Fusibacter sp. A1]
MAKKTLKQSITLSKEATYLNTRSFIVKSGLAMLFAFWLGAKIPIANKDMISFLFGLMMSLEPISITGFRRGLDQFRATVIGGVLTAVIIAVVGINPLGLAISMSAILYFTLSHNWREVSVVALFTGIYMTQFVQTTTLGDPDILMTMIVRITALTSGILFAMVFNILTSFVLSPKLPANRIGFLKYRYHKHVRSLLEKLTTQDHLDDSDYLSLANLFNDIDWTLTLLTDLLKDPMLKWGRIRKDSVETAILQAKTLRSMSHYLYDLEIYLRTYDFDHSGDDKKTVIEILTCVNHAVTGGNTSYCEKENALNVFTQRIRDDLIKLLDLSNSL